MIECLILGDSIATGIAKFRPECVSYASVGLSSRQFNKKYDVKDISADTTIISLGTNDTGRIDTYYELLRLRYSLSTKKVIWIMPANVNRKSGTSISIVQSSIENIAKVHNDVIVTIPKPMADRYHPTVNGYKKIAKQTKR